MIRKYLNHFSLQSVSQSLILVEKEKFDKNFVWQDSYVNIEEIWVKIGCVLSFCICILLYDILLYVQYSIDDSIMYMAQTHEHLG